MKRASLYKLKGKGQINFLDATFNIGPLFHAGLHFYKPGESHHLTADEEFPVVNLWMAAEKNLDKSQVD